MITIYPMARQCHKKRRPSAALLHPHPGPYIPSLKTVSPTPASTPSNWQTSIRCPSNIYHHYHAISSGSSNSCRPVKVRYATSILGERYLLYESDKGCVHPLWPWGTAIVVLTEVSDDAVKQNLRKYAGRTIPTGLRNAKELEDRGYVELKPGYGLFTRIVENETDQGDSTHAKDDEIQGWVADYDLLVQKAIIHSKTLDTRLQILAEDILGPVNEHSSSPPHTSTNPKGGIALERLLWHVTASPANKQGSRCYSMGYTIEQPRSLIHPARTMKYHPDIPMNEDMRTRLVQTVTEYGGAAMKLAPLQRTDLMRNISEINQIPPLGHTDNQNFWTGLQVNVSRPVLHGANEQLRADLGRAGDVHPDVHNDIGSFTTMIVLTRTPETYTPAFFFLLEFGVFIQMDYRTIITFSGLRLHGRAPSTAPPTVDTIPEDCYSIITVLYNTSDVAKLTKNRLSLFPPPIERRTAAELGVQALPPEAWQNDSEEFVNDPTYQSNMFTDGHMLAGDRLPGYNLKLMSRLLRYINRFSPIYMYNWNPSELITDTEVKIRNTDEVVFPTEITISEAEEAQIQSEWNDLVTRNRILLGAQDKIVYNPIATAPERLANLQSSHNNQQGKRKRLICEVVIPMLKRPNRDHSNSNAASSSSRELRSSKKQDSTHKTPLTTPSTSGDSRSATTQQEVPIHTPDSNEDENETDIADTEELESDTAHASDHMSPKKKDYKAALMSIFDEQYLDSIYKDLKERLTMKPDSVQTYAVPKPIQTASLSTALLAFMQTDSNPTLQRQSPQDIILIWEQISKGRTNLKKLGVTTKLIRHGVMLGLWKTWEFMEVHCRKDCEDVLWENKTNDLTKLVRKVLQHLTTNAKTALRLSAKTYIQNFNGDAIATIVPKQM
ncbi:hypothetical protein OE88DRAFT_1644538 [Heliocybe sulcata]|uniref:Uncharacterized protein n=1 Tax=Heliocybe sulcata TaxID=5364 RepID=A0A5C3N3T8_9AGAM|nr:hypothetical protein OE88DRAFT_1644538 [Heliocybe sulcata]